MIHSRPGFAPRKSDVAPAKLNKDMIPALHRAKDKADVSTLKQIELPRTAREIAADALHEQIVREAQIAAQRAGPEILVNPAPTEPPVVNEIGK